jgi:zinc protease
VSRSPVTSAAGPQLAPRTFTSGVGRLVLVRRALPAAALALAACATSSQQRVAEEPQPQPQAAAARAAAAAPADTGFPTSPPPAAPVRPAEFPPFQEATLSNGVRLVVVESRVLPIVSLSLAMPAGSVHAPEGREGLPSMLAALLTKGAGERSADEIAEAIESAGGSISAGAGSDFLTVDVGGLSSAAPLAFELMGDVVARATLPESEVELQRQQTLSGLRLAQGQPSSLAQRAFISTLYGSHPYARQSTPESVEAITRAELVAFRDRYLKPQGALLVVAGDISLADARRLAEDAFRGWTGAPPAAPAQAAIPEREDATVVLVHRPGSVQSTIMAGNTTYTPDDPRHYASVVANRILGGGSQGRLFQILREQKGWTYGAYSSLVRRAGTGYFVAQADVRTEVTDSAVAEIITQLVRLRSEPMPQEELELAKSTLVGQFPLTIQTAGQVAGAVRDARLYGLPDDYLQAYRTRLAAVTAQELMGAADFITRGEGAVVVVVGDGTKIYEPLRRVAPGAITIVNAEGDTLQPSDLAAGSAAMQAPSQLDPSRVAATRDRYSVVMQGNALGSMVRDLRRDGSSWVLTDTSSIAGVSQVTVVRLGGDLSLQSVSQRGSIQGRDTRIDVTVSNGTATGTAVSPLTQFEERAVNATISAATVDDNSFPSLLGALPLAEGATFDVPVFSSGSGAVTTQKVTVEAAEEITVPAGTFRTWRISISGGQAPTNIWISLDSPYRMVKMAPVGAPIEIVLDGE